MLQTQTVSTELLELLNNIMKSDFFSDFILVGGTALALQIGHRNSIDIDMFGNSIIDEDAFIDELNRFGKVEKLQKTKNILIVSVNNIKVDFVNYHYPLLEDFKNIDGVRMASKKDIAAMKLNAISGRGSRKDFIDLFFLLKEFSLEEMIKFYDDKYEDGSHFLMIKSLTYFEDANFQESPEIFEKFDWEKCKQTITKEYLKLML
ncbi:hypothetical protein BA768_18505 [Chryseobacterium sp. CBo1]|nr:hypothetical protein BA768_18505 [Chryseobacterium sp. CBo1]